MKKISSIVRVLEAIKPLQLQLHIFPENYISFSGTEGYAIVQLLDGEGLPVLAEEDIPLKLIVENPDVSINTSGNFEEVIIEKDQLVIEKGSYSAFTTFSPRPNLGEFTSSLQQKYNISNSPTTCGPFLHVLSLIKVSHLPTTLVSSTNGNIRASDRTSKRTFLGLR